MLLGSITLSRLYVAWQHVCLLHSEHGCSVDATKLVQPITVVPLVMREVGSAVVHTVILCLRRSVARALSVVFLSHYVTSICFCDHQL
jgi:hypothetical protein